MAVAVEVAAALQVPAVAVDVAAVLQAEQVS
jgi:hypothetical protein